jgi:hypothetical protein
MAEVGEPRSGWRSADGHDSLRMLRLSDDQPKRLGFPHTNRREILRSANGASEGRPGQRSSSPLQLCERRFDPHDESAWNL